MGVDKLHPTTWRTCRVLANHTRLQMLALLLHEPKLTVSAVAERLRLALPRVSSHLRALESRGFLAVHRVGRHVTYRWSPLTSETAVQALLSAMREVLQSKHEPIEVIFKTATAFTHPRRLEIVRTLNESPRTFEILQRTTHIPRPALFRHLNKLRARRFLSFQSGWFLIETPADPIGRELLRMAVEG